MSEDVSPVRPGDIVGGKYRVERTLGAGGMGVVVAATQTELDRPVALKFLLPKLLERPGLVTRFSREARAAAKLESEHVARVLDVGTLEGGAPYIVMEYLEGHDLASLLAARGALPIDEAVGYVLQACEAIAEAHSYGIVHRDLKPGNLFLANRTSGAPVIKVLDFGLSKIASSDGENVTTDSSILGSPLYMSPEQLMSASTADARSDLWSMGVVLYELVAGHSPFEYERIAGLVVAILQKPALPIDQWRGGVPPELQAVILRCLEKEPSQRFANVAHLARALAPFGPPGSARSVERIAHVLRSHAPSPVATDAITEAAHATTEAGPAASATAPGSPPDAESVAGSSRSVRQPSPDSTLPSLPMAVAPWGRGRRRAGVVGGAVAAGVAAVAGFLALSRPDRDANRGLVVPSAAISVSHEAATSALPPPTNAGDSATLVPQAAESVVSSPAPSVPAASTKKRPRLAPVASAAAPAAPPPAAPPPPAPAPAAPPRPAPGSNDPLRRLQPM